MTPNDLIAFEEDIAAEFNAGNIPYPVHLSNGNEVQLIRVFKDIAREDWVLGSWRLHYQALLHGVPPDELKAAILRGESMALNFPEYRVLGSAIVGGTLPIAVGIAIGIKRAGGSERVHVFCGDMTALAGIFTECRRYGENHELPVRFVVEDNGVSVCTNTRDAWGRRPSPVRRIVHRYKYKSKWPHAGAGKRIQF